MNPLQHERIGQLLEELSAEMGFCAVMVYAPAQPGQRLAPVRAVFLAVDQASLQEAAVMLVTPEES